MSRYRHFLEVDVLTAARARVRHIYETFDTVAVCFSGGKDSLVCLHLAREEAERRGQRVHVVFRDEELIPDEVINFVDHYRGQPWVEMRWFCVPLKSTKFVLGQTFDYVQWDPGRPHVRPMPAWGIRDDRPGGAEPLSQFTADAFCARGYPGRVAFITGIRAAESLIRYRSCVSKIHENYIVHSSTPNVMLAKPIYDWQEDDVFRFFFDHGIQYCATYDAQMWAGKSLRVATPLVSEGAKKFDQERKYAGPLYARIIEVFPEMLLQERYWRELAPPEAVAAETMEDVMTWAREHLDGKQLELAERAIRGAIRSLARYPDSFTVAWVMREVRNGMYKRGLIHPMGREAQDKFAGSGIHGSIRKA